MQIHFFINATIDIGVVIALDSVDVAFNLAINVAEFILGFVASFFIFRGECGCNFGMGMTRDLHPVKDCAELLGHIVLLDIWGIVFAFVLRAVAVDVLAFLLFKGNAAATIGAVNQASIWIWQASPTLRPNGVAC